MIEEEQLVEDRKRLEHERRPAVVCRDRLIAAHELAMNGMPGFVRDGAHALTLPSKPP